MWIFLNDAFLSIVEYEGLDGKPTGDLLVRSRQKGDIGRVFPGVRIARTPDADYLYRAVVDRQRVAGMLAERVLGIDYPNFKDSVANKRRALLYTRVWTTVWSFFMPQNLGGTITGRYTGYGVGNLTDVDKKGNPLMVRQTPFLD